MIMMLQYILINNAVFDSQSQKQKSANNRRTTLRDKSHVFKHWNLPDNQAIRSKYSYAVAMDTMLKCRA